MGYKNIARLLKSASTTQPIEQEFLADLKWSMEKTDKKHSRKPSESYKPSSMNCIRNMYYQRSGKEPMESSSTYTLIGICNSGTDIHERIQQAIIDMKENGIDCDYLNVADYVEEHGLLDTLDIVKRPDPEHGEYETKLFHKGLHISFLCDGIIRYKGRYLITEFKTEGSNKWMMRKGVDSKHYNQGISYSMMFGLSNVLFIYINRDIFDMKSYLFTPTQEQKDELHTRLTTCEEFVQRKELPPMPDKEVLHGSCTYCNYKMYCEANMN